MDQEQYVPIDDFLASDRQAGLGRLSAAVLHAMNNVLSGALGQLEIITWKDVKTIEKEDVTKIISMFDEGVTLSRVFMFLSDMLYQHREASVSDAMRGLLLITERIYRKNNLKIDRRISAELPPAVNSAMFIQAALHALLACFKLESGSGNNDPRLAISLVRDGDEAVLNIELGSARIEGAVPETLNSNEPPSQEETAFHFWVINKLCRIQGNWKVDSDGQLFSFRYPLLTA